MDAKFLSFKNGIEALRQISEESFSADYIFLDINMPEMSGKECLLEIKKIKHLRKVPVYIYTTSTYELDRVQFLSFGAFKFISKPSKMSELISTLREIVI